MRKFNAAPYPLYGSYLKADAAFCPVRKGTCRKQAEDCLPCLLTQLLGPHGVRLSPEGRRSFLLPSEEPWEGAGNSKRGRGRMGLGKVFKIGCPSLGTE